VHSACNGCSTNNGGIPRAKEEGQAFGVAELNRIRKDTLNSGSVATAFCVGPHGLAPEAQS
jgi:hypothetical protein